MKMNISEFAKFTGVSVRTLHYYDEIGLLKPDFIDERNNYRFYGKNAAEKMQEILFYRELDFSLKDIQRIISSIYNKKKVLKGQKELLILKRARLNRIIDTLTAVERGEIMLNFDAFKQNEFNSYKDEVKERWGNTYIYQENKQKTSNYTNDYWNSIKNDLNDIILEFARIKNSGEPHNSAITQNQVKKLQEFITATQYTCTDEILYSLGKMYVVDQRFKVNIDKAGNGTAEYISKAIKCFCKFDN